MLSRAPEEPFINARDYGAVGDGATDDTKAIQAAIDTAVNAGGGRVFIPPGIYLLSAALIYRSHITLLGAGMGASQLWQLAGTADVYVKSYDGSQRTEKVTIEGLTFNGFNNQAACLGGVVLEGTEWGKVRDCSFNALKVFSVRVLGGATQGDAMYTTIAGNVFENLPHAGDVAVLISPSTRVVGGSHPDGTTVIDNTVNSSLGTAFKIEAPGVDAAGALGCDNCQFIANRTIEVPSAFDLVGQNIHVAFNRCEVVNTATLTVTVRAGTANFPTTDVVFLGNGWPTRGDVGSFIFTDNGERTVRLADNDASGTQYLIGLFGGAYTHRVRTNGDSNDRFAIRADGQVEWGPGNAATDTKLTRAGAGLLRFFGEYNVLVGVIGQKAYSANIGGEGGRRWQLLAGGELDIGPGDGSFDVHLARDVAGKRWNLTEQFAAGDGVTGKYLSGPGKTTVIDADFAVVPGNGMFAVHRDTTAGKTYFSVRANGAWTVIAGPL